MRRLVALSSTTRMRLPASCGCWPRKSRRWPCGSSAGTQRMVKWKVRALARPGALGPHRAAHQLGQQLADRQAQPGAAVLARGAAVGLAELLEQARQAGLAQADAGVAHGEVQQAAFAGLLVAFGAHAQHHLALLGELHRVGQQVQQDLPQPRHVAVDGRRHLAFEDVGDVQVLLGRARGRSGPSPIPRTRAGRRGGARCPCARPRSWRSRGCR